MLSYRADRTDLLMLWGRFTTSIGYDTLPISEYNESILSVKLTDLPSRHSPRIQSVYREMQKAYDAVVDTST